jgi:hypothetical protein
LPFLPVILNIVSVAISTTTNEDRYLMLTPFACLMLLPYTVLAYKEAS